ncbi:hypothetical protein ONZ45_g1793 [Pleurotus djamor]|nr:hypothetical protein ONZ45_g1793 [Pleurotus djamor]
MSPRSRSDNLSSYFDRSANAVREYADVLEHNYARPALVVGSAYYDQHPIISVFLVTLFCLSIIPALTFIGFSIFAGVSLALIAISGAVGAFVFVELLFVSIFLCVLIAVVCFSGLMTGSIISLYVFIRLAVLVRYEGRSGLKLWLREMKSLYVQERHPVSPPSEPLYEDDTKHRKTQADAPSSFAEEEEIYLKEEEEPPHDQDPTPPSEL